MSDRRQRQGAAVVIAFPSRAYTVEVTYRVRARHQVLANSPAEAEELAPDEVIMGGFELLDILDSRIVDVPSR